MIINIDGFDIDTTRVGKKIIFRYNDNKKPEVTFTLDFPPYTETQEFDTEKQAADFITELKTDGDKVRYE